ncbi:hypothetical protein ABH908_001532 [Pseudomonas frederiksbergensis]
MSDRVAPIGITQKTGMKKATRRSPFYSLSQR